jgi:hypothetical protein
MRFPPLVCLARLIGLHADPLGPMSCAFGICGHEPPDNPEKLIDYFSAHHQFRNVISRASVNGRKIATKLLPILIGAHHRASVRLSGMAFRLPDMPSCRGLCDHFRRRGPIRHHPAHVVH